MHWVQFGNEHAREAYHEASEGLQHRPVEGRQITAVLLPDGWGLQEMYQATVAAAGHHFDTDPATDDKHPPAWIESSSDPLLSLLVEHYRLERNTRPAGWADDHPSVSAVKQAAQR